MEQFNNLISGTLSIGLILLIAGVGIGYSIGIHRTLPEAGNHMMSSGALMNNDLMQ